MELEEFKNLAKKCGAGEYYKERDLGQVFYSKWCIGGETGNSCFGRDPRPVSPDEPIDGIPELDIFLSKITPTITFIQYKLICAEMEKGTTSSGTDYYGNYYDYAYSAISVEKLYNKLKELNVIIESTNDLDNHHNIR